MASDLVGVCVEFEGKEEAMSLNVVILLQSCRSIAWTKRWSIRAET